MIADLTFSTLRLAIPILFAAFGGMLSERSGVANITLEAGLLFSAFAAATVTWFTGSPWCGLGAAMLASAAMSFAFAAICVWGRGDQIVIGTAFNLLALGLIPVLSKALFNVTGSTPALPAAQTFHLTWPFFLSALLVLAACEYLFRHTRHGLRILAAGENPAALETQGVNFRAVRLRAVTEGGLLTGIGGAYLSLCQGSGFIREMSAGRGFIALAALIFGGWRPLPTLIAALFFALTDAVQIQMQGREVGGYVLPNQFVQITPYLATLLVLVVYARKMRAPAALNQ